MNLKSKKSLMKVLLAPFLLCLTIFASGIYDNGNTALATDLETTKDYSEANKADECEKIKKLLEEFAALKELEKKYDKRVNNLPDAVETLRKGVESQEPIVELIVDKDPDNPACRDFSGLNDDEIAALIFSKYIDANFKLDCNVILVRKSVHNIAIDNIALIYFGTDHYGYKNQEEQIQINNRTLEVRKELKLDGKSDFEKVELICNYIVKNVEYDEDKRTLYDASVSGKGNCVARSAWFCKLCREENIRSEVICGLSKDAGPGHAWNIVKIGDLFYYVDVTAVTNDGISEEYFLKGENNFPNLNSFERTLGQIFASKFFQEVCPISKLDYFDMESFGHHLRNRMEKYFLIDEKLKLFEKILTEKENIELAEKSKELEKFELNEGEICIILDRLESDYKIVSQISSKKAEETRSLLKTYIDRINRVRSLL